MYESRAISARSRYYVRITQSRGFKYAICGCLTLPRVVRREIIIRIIQHQRVSKQIILFFSFWEFKNEARIQNYKNNYGQ